LPPPYPLALTTGYELMGMFPAFVDFQLFEHRCTQRLCGSIP
jgi:hypothetical protein